MLFIVAFLPLLTLISAGPIAKRDDDDCSSPSVTIYPPTDLSGDGIQITGSSNASTGLDSYLGIPYAEAPTGSLRFQAPSYRVYDGDFNATAQPSACPQPGITNNTEDCLYLDVYRPTYRDPDGDLFPVMVWVHGGEFTVGDVSLYDPTYPMIQGIQTGKPFIFVSIQYRLGVLGWAGGSEIANISAGNNGLKDINLALKWVADNIGAWDGDSDSVTVFGHSAGAVSISLLYLGPDDPYFNGAIMQSGSQSSFPLIPTEDAWQDEVDLFVELLNCTDATEGVIQCLQTVPVDILIESQSIIAGLTDKMFWGPTIDGYFIPGSPHDLLAAGNFSQVRFIIGDVLDEGTYVAVAANVSSEDDIIALANDYLPTPLPDSITQEIFQLYPDDPAVGSPYGTGNDTFGYPKEVKQLASIFGDVVYHAPRRWFLEQASAYGVDAWSYSWEEPLADPSQAPYGVGHGTDVIYFFGGDSLSQYGFSEDQVALARVIIDRWIAFAYAEQPINLSPYNPLNISQLYWPSYDMEGIDQTLFRFKAGNLTLGTDDFRQNGTDYLNAHAAYLHY